MEDFCEIQSKLTIGQRLRDVRWRLDLTQAQMAEKLGICRATLIAWERQSEDPDSAYLNTLKALIEMGISADWLLTGKPPRRLESRRLEPSKSPEETDHAPEPAPEPDDSPSVAAPTGAAQEVLDDRDISTTERECLAPCRGGCSVPTEPAATRAVIEIPGGGN